MIATNIPMSAPIAAPIIETSFEILSPEQETIFSRCNPQRLLHILSDTEQRLFVQNYRDGLVPEFESYVSFEEDLGHSQKLGKQQPGL